RAGSDEAVSQTETEILGSSMVRSIVENSDPIGNVWGSPRILEEIQWQSDIHCESSTDPVVDVHRNNLSTNLTLIEPVSQHVQMIFDIEILVAERDAAPALAGHPSLSGYTRGRGQL